MTDSTERSVTVVDPTTGSRTVPLSDNGETTVSTVLDYLGGTWSSTSRYYRINATNNGSEEVQAETPLQPGDQLTVMNATKGGSMV